MRGYGVAALAACVTLASACSDAKSEVSGGEDRFDASSPQFVADSGTSGGGTTWTAIYKDLFAPGSGGGCAGTGACHGTKDQQGAKSSGGFVCPDKDGCLASLKDKGTGPLLKPEDKDAAEKSGIYGVLRRVENGRTIGIMPKTPAYVFRDDELTRLKTWIANGAPND